MCFCRHGKWACLYKSLSLQTKKFAGEDVEAQTEQVLKNLGAILKAAGSDYSKVIKTTVLLESMDDFAKVNAIYGEQLLVQGLLPPMHQPDLLLISERPHNAGLHSLMTATAATGRYFSSDPPARACFAVKTLPLNAKVEIEANAAV